MKKSTLKTFRDLRHMKARTVFIWFLVAVVVLIYAGGFMARDSLFNTRETLCKRLRLSDLQVIFTPASPDEMPDLTGLKSKAWITRRLLSPGGLE